MMTYMTLTFVSKGIKGYHTVERIIKCQRAAQESQKTESRLTLIVLTDLFIGLTRLMQCDGR